MLPEEGGYYRWVDRAFGRFWAFQNGWLTWMYSLVDMAIYPVLFNQYLHFFIPGLDARVEWLISLAIIWGAAWINVRGSVNVTRVSIIAGSFIMLGFLALSVASAPRITHIPWQPFASEHARGLGGFAVGISIALWNYIGWDNPSTVQGEVKDPSRTYPRALAFALPLVTIGYFVPLLTTLGASDWTTWTEGGWPQIAASAAGSAGRWIAIWIALGGMISALALFNALLLGYSRIPFVLAGDGLLPKPLAKLDVHGTPRTAIIVSAVFYSLFALVAFGKLIVADVLLYSVALFLEFGALIQLRKTEPSLRGVFRSSRMASGTRGSVSSGLQRICTASCPLVNRVSRWMMPFSFNASVTSSSRCGLMPWARQILAMALCEITPPSSAESFRLDQCVEHLRVYKEMGFDEVTLRMTGWDQFGQLDRVMREVLPCLID